MLSTPLPAVEPRKHQPKISSIMLWDMDKEQPVKSISSSSNCSVTALISFQVHTNQFTAGFVDGSVRLYNIQTLDMLVCATRPRTQQVEKVVGIGFQPGLDQGKIVSASQAALVVHRHAQIIVSGSAKQLTKSSVWKANN